MRTLPVVLAGLTVLLTSLAPSHSLGGAYNHPDNGAEAVGSGGAVVAGVDNASALYFNPANLTELDGFSVYLASNFTLLAVDFTRAGLDHRLIPDPDTGELSLPPFGERKETPFETVSRACEEGPLCTPLGFAAPMIFAGYGGDGWGAAIGAWGPPGVGVSEFPEDGSQRYGMIRQELAILWLGAGGAYKVGPVRLGVTALLGKVDVLYRMMLDANATVMQSESMSQNYRGESSDRYNQAFDLPVQIEVSGWAPAAIAGLTWEAAPELLVAASVQTTARFEAEGELAIDFARSDAIPENLATLSDDAVSLEILQPWIVRLGAQWSYLRSGVALFDVELDAVYESWSQTEELRLVVPGGFGNPDSSEFKPIGAISLVKNWKDSFGLRFGSNIHPTEWWTARLGTFVETGTVPEETTNLDVYSYNRLGVGLGSTFRTPFGLDVAIGYEHIFQATRQVDSSEVRANVPLSLCTEPFQDAAACPVVGEPPGDPVGAGTYDVSYDIMSLALIYRH